MSEEKAKSNLNQPLPLTEQERTMCIKICSLLPSSGFMFEESPFLIDVLASAAHKGDCFEEIVAEPLLGFKNSKGIQSFFSLFKIWNKSSLSLMVIKRK